jgi:hypothetical protein
VIQLACCQPGYSNVLARISDTTMAVVGCKKDSYIQPVQLPDV